MTLDELRAEIDRIDDEIAPLLARRMSLAAQVAAVKRRTGAPMFGGVENRLAAALFGIPAVRGVEFGAGFSAAALRGSENNDEYFVENGQIRTRTNHHGGVLGGLTTGMPLVLRVAVKPTPSIAIKQNSVDLRTLEEVDLAITGRHDACIVPRAVPVVEAVTACVLLDLMMEAKL